MKYLQKNRISPISFNCPACDIVFERVKKFQIIFGVGVFLMSQSQEWNFSFWQEDRDFSWLVFSPISNSSMKCPWRLPMAVSRQTKRKRLVVKQQCCTTGYLGVLFVLLELFVFDDFVLWWLSGFFHATNVLDCCLLGCVCTTLFRDIIAEHMMDTSQGYMIGGPGCTVEVDESLFGWLNHNLVSYLNCVVNR